MQADPSYRPPDRSAAAAAGAGAGAVTPSRRVPAPRRQLQARPIEHPLWRNKRGTEVGAGRSGRLGHCAMKLGYRVSVCHAALL
jgi:hypothetical protein